MGSKRGLVEAVLISTLVLLVVVNLPATLHGVTMHDIRKLRAENRLSCLLVFGDSSVDPGNNNYIATATKSNFPPYGMDFVDRRPTGRFSDGRLATDFIGEAFGCGKLIPGFLDPNLTKEDLLHGVSFASAGSGYDDLTSNLYKTLSIGAQVNYLRHYKIHLREIMGYKKTDEMLNKAIIIISMGTNDYLQNYFVEPTRPKQFTLDKYQDYLVSRMRHVIEDMYNLGARRIAIVGVPPLGCMPLVITIAGDGSHCVEKFNKAVISLNTKIQREVEALHTELKMKTVYIDAYGPIESAINNPKNYGFKETSKGCCGTGTFEMGDTCKGLETCEDPKEYIFWDAVHPSERMYKILANNIVETLPLNFFT